MLNNSTIPIKKCKCGCGKPYTISYNGFNINCAPQLLKDDNVKKRQKQHREAQQRAISKKKLHEVNRETFGAKFASMSAKRKTPIPKYSKKMITNLKIYSVLRKDYLKDHKYCLAKLGMCKMKATEIHHMKGRLGELLNVVDFWLPVCSPCHRYITDHPKEAMELGLVISRLNNDTL